MQFKLETIQLINFTERICAISKFLPFRGHWRLNTVFTKSRHMSLFGTIMDAVQSITSISPKVN
jgi:hypothetical protein